jgi:hypothetical protein
VEHKASAENKPETHAIKTYYIGILQGNSLSPLFFCIALISLTHELNRSEYRYMHLKGK